MRAARSAFSKEAGSRMSQCPYSLEYINDSMAQQSALPGRLLNGSFQAGPRLGERASGVQRSS